MIGSHRVTIVSRNRCTDVYSESLHPMHACAISPIRRENAETMSLVQKIPYNHLRPLPKKKFRTFLTNTRLVMQQMNPSMD